MVQEGRKKGYTIWSMCDSYMESLDTRVYFTAIVALVIFNDQEPSSEMWGGRLPFKTTVEKRKPGRDITR